MAKINVNAHNIATLLQGILADSDVDMIITDTSAPGRWQGKKLSEILSLEWYSYKYRPVDTYTLIDRQMQDGIDSIDRMQMLNRGFASLWFSSQNRLYSKDQDTVSMSVGLEFWVQSEKIQLLEQWLDSASMATAGIRIPCEFGSEIRQATLIFDNLSISDIQSGTVCGEMAVCSTSIDIVLYQESSSYSDYTVSFSWVDDADGSIVQSEPLQLNNFNITNSMNANSVPTVTNTLAIGSVNLSRNVTYDLNFDGFNNTFINYLVANSLTGASTIDNNKMFNLIITRGKLVITNQVVINSHSITVTADASNENHRLTVTTRGMVDVGFAI